jgi:dTDP-4-dehydrorhamnose reductase
MKIAILAKSGMLGSCFFHHLAVRERVEVFAFDKEELDITDSASVERTLARISPDFVINCSGYTAVDNAETDKDAAFRVNGYACGKLAEACKNSGAILIHFSTDYVFDGESGGGYAENDKPNPINVYGASKLEGENLIQKNSDKYYIIRTSWLFGENGKNFVGAMLELGKTKKSLNVVGDQIGCPTYTNDLCEAVIKNFLSGGGISESGLPFGIYHLTNSGTCSWYDFAKKIFEFSKMEVEVNKVSSDEFVRQAKRPKCSILKNTKIAGLRPWEEALMAYLRLGA